MGILLILYYPKYLINSTSTAEQFPPAELAVKVPKRVFYDGSSEIESGPAFKCAKFAEPAPHSTYWKTKEAPR